MRCVTTRTGRQHTVMTADRWVWVGVLAASATLYPLYTLYLGRVSIA